jgi:polyisoprenoid-binding protein YceI
VSKLLKIIVVGVLGVAAFAAAYFLFFNDDSPPEFKPSTPAASTSSTDVTGTWTVASGSQAGFRAREKLASLPAKSDAVGRTGDVTGSITITATSVTKADFEVDLTTLKSEPAEPRRDSKIGPALETDTFPKATFTLTRPITIDPKKTTASVEATGDLTIHGVTKSETIPITATVVKAQLELVGKVTFPFADFKVHQPSFGGFVTVDDVVALEFKLLLEKQS